MVYIDNLPVARLTERLKEETRANHQLLEKKLIAQMRSIRVIQDYVDLLTSFYRYFGGLEKLIVHQMDQLQLPDYALRRKSAALAGDLSELGAKLPVFASVPELPVIQSHSQALGALYVMEGSTLGGPMISSMVSRALPSVAGRGTTFFTGYGQDTAAMWTRFKEMLDGREDLPEEEIIYTANETFRKFNIFLTDEVN